jgi:formylglycine-generating enzyme required for sulfatase activity
MIKQKDFGSSFFKIIVLCLCLLMLHANLPTQTAQMGSQTGSDSYEGTFNWAKRFYMQGKYNDARKKLELLLTFLDPQAIEKQDIAVSESSRQLLGKIQLLLGAVHEKMGKKKAAATFYKQAKSTSQQLTATGKPGVAIDELDVNALPGCQEHFLGQEEIVTSESAYDAGLIEKEANKSKKKKKARLRLIVGAAIAAAVIVTVILLKKMENKFEVDPDYDTRELKIQWVIIHGNPLLMGSDSPDAEPDEQPVHQIHLNPYYISRYEITFKQYQMYLDDTGNGTVPSDEGWGRENRPVINVSHQDAEDFCAWLSWKTSKLIRLPTEAQWENAASGSNPFDLSPTVYPWGNSPHDCSKANWCCQQRTMPVGSYPGGASYFGIHDMAGNVAEWCRDWYWEDYYAVSEEVDPKGPDPRTTGINFDRKVVRGGSWDCSEQPGIRISDRGSRQASQTVQYKSNSIGFRIVWKMSSLSN